MDNKSKIFREKIRNKSQGRKWLFFVSTLVFLISGKYALAQTPAPISHDVDVNAQVLPSPLSITIFNIVESNITRNSAMITWETDVASQCNFYYGKTLSYELGTLTESANLLNHSASLSGLSEGTDYFYRIYCFVGNQTGEENGLSFTTLNGANNNPNNPPNPVITNRGEIVENPRPIVNQEYPPYEEITGNKVPVRSLVQPGVSDWGNLLPLLIAFLALLSWLFLMLIAKRSMGIVLYPDDKRVKKALIEIWDSKDKKMIRSLKADKNGRYRFRLNAGKYNLKFFNPERSQSWIGQVTMQKRGVYKEKIILEEEKKVAN